MDPEFLDDLWDLPEGASFALLRTGRHVRTIGYGFRSPRSGGSAFEWLPASALRAAEAHIAAEVRDLWQMKRPKDSSN